MIDKTTEGITAEPEEVEAILHNLCGFHLADPDPVHRYTVLTREQVLYSGLVAAIKRERGRALADLAASGQPLTHIAAMTNLRTRQRVQRLIAVAKAADEAIAAVQAASREFDEKLAAVEATLDEVVSGFIPVVTDAAPTDALDPEPTDGDVANGSVVAMLEPTQVLPALAAIMHPTKEMPPSDELPWWRRGRDSGAA